MTIYLRIPNLHAQHDKGKAFRYVFVGPEGTWSFLSIVDGKDLWRLQLVIWTKADYRTPTSPRSCALQGPRRPLHDRGQESLGAEEHGG